MNAFGVDAQFALAAEIEALGRRDDVRVIIIAAVGKGFFAGLDIKEMAADPSLIVGANQANYDTFAAVHLNPKPVIAALHGYVLGGGIGIAGSADVVVAADDAYFGVPEIDRGGMGMGAHLQRMFSVQKVRYMYFTGDTIDAAEAYRLGAVERVVQRAELRPAAREIALQDGLQVAPDDPHRQTVPQWSRGRQPRGQVPLGAGLHLRGLPDERLRRGPQRLRGGPRAGLRFAGRHLI